MLGNRVKKTWKKLHPRFERERIGAFRLYDWDIPEIRAVVDWIEGHLVVAEYARRQTDELPDWLGNMGRACAAVLGVREANLHLRSRRTRPKDGPRYERLGQGGARLVCREGKLKFWVNLDDYLDVGLFPDHRRTRARVGAESQGKAVLNLFGYTGSFTCYAAAGGATRTTTVDTSGPYLAWARENLTLNGITGEAHKLVKGEVRAFLQHARRRRDQWDLAVVDPPSFSERPEGSFDVQRDHRELVESVLPVMSPGGIIYFAANHQQFVPDLAGLDAEEISADTHPVDYRRSPHRAWRIRVSS
jgi:23S rRNA (cytosine1962-C5)-methyltransferase